MLDPVPGGDRQGSRDLPSEGQHSLGQSPGLLGGSTDAVEIATGRGGQVGIVQDQFGRGQRGGKGGVEVVGGAGAAVGFAAAGVAGGCARVGVAAGFSFTGMGVGSLVGGIAVGSSTAAVGAA